jgi:Fe-S-cluster containining protein
VSQPTGPDHPIPFSFALRIGGETLDISGSVPAGECRTTDLVPLLLGLCEAITGAAVRELPPTRKVSCGPGCGACCRQLVPISQTEAAWLRDVVLPGLDPAHRDRVASRLREAAAILETSGLTQPVRGLPAESDPERRQATGLRYFLAGIPCPFLEDESCSIHPQRPLACREYLVTSPAVACAHPEPGAISPVPIPLKPSHALIRLDARSSAPGWRTMIDALLTPDPQESPTVPDAIGLLKDFLAAMLKP